MIDAGDIAYSTVAMFVRTASFLVGFLFILLVFSWAGCGRSFDGEDETSGSMESPMAVAMGEDSESFNDDGDEAVHSAEKENVPKLVDRKIIYSADVRLVLKKKPFENFEEEIENLIQKYKGRKSVAIVRRNQGENRSGKWVIRVPVKDYPDFLKAVKELGVTENVEESSKDVTAEYVDLEARLGAQKKLEHRILGVLEEVRGKIQEVLNVERELARVRQVIERLEGQRRVLTDRIEMTTVTVFAREDENYVPPTALSFGDRIMNVWKSSLNALKEFFKSLVLVMVSAVPWLVVGVPGLYLLMRLFRSWRTRRGKGSGQETP